jgi:aminopeptidase N
MYVTAPRENKVAGVGNLISEITHGNLLTTYWKSRYPIVPYLVAIAVTPYAEVSFNTSLTTGSLFVQNYVYKEDSASVIDQLLATDVLLRYYDSLIGPYPFMKEKYGHAQFGRGGGMEHQTMSFMTHFGFALNAHEMAHQWFGDKITCGSWSDIWLNEGFATYFAGLPLETMYNGDYWMDWKKRYLERATQEPDGSVYVEDTTDVGRIFNPYLSYAKGGYVLHMLRSQIGDSSFFAGIKSYANDPKLSYKTALTGDLFRHMEQSSGIDLSVYKNQWIYGKGFPSYNLEWEQSGLELQFRLSQTTSDASIPFFYIKVPILLQGEHGEQYWITINPETNGQEFRFTVPFQVVKVNIDPNLDIISKANFVINTASLTDVHIYPNPAVNFLSIAPGGDFKRVTGYQIISSDGKIIQQTSGLNNSFSWTINLETCSHGTYIIIIYSDEKSITKGFVVTR